MDKASEMLADVTTTLELVRGSTLLARPTDLMLDSWMRRPPNLEPQ